MPDAALITVLHDGTGFQIVKSVGGSPKGIVYSVACAQQYMPEPTIVTLDMGDFASSLLAAGKVENRGRWLQTGVYRNGGMKLVSYQHPDRHITRDFGFAYTFSRPAKTLMLEAKQVLWEDKHRVLIPFYDGTFKDFEKNLTAICTRSEIEP